MDDSSYHEKWSFRVSTLNLLSLLGLYTIVLLVGFLLLFRFTGLKALISPDNSYENEQLLTSNDQRLDSLTQQIADTELYLQELNLILNDGPFSDSISNDTTNTLSDYTPDFSKSSADSALRLKVEQDMNQMLGGHNAESFTFFFPPVKGLVSQSFSAADHPAVDVVTAEEDPIKACLEGTIIFTGWVQDEGHILMIQHQENLISIYKHCSAILKETGTKVQAGDPVAIVGNSGELTSGPHLHFELWKRGLPIDPENYILFQ